MIGTGKYLTAEEIVKAKELRKWANEAPVMTVRSDLPTFAESALKDLFEWIEKRAIEKGLTVFPDNYYGLDNDGQIMWPEGFDGPLKTE